MRMDKKFGGKMLGECRIGTDQIQRARTAQDHRGEMPMAVAERATDRPHFGRDGCKELLDDAASIARKRP